MSIMGETKLAAVTMLTVFAFAQPAFAQAGLCPLPEQKPMTITTLFFGLSIPGRVPLTDAEWKTFAAKVLTRNFPDGFTAYDGDGQWWDQVHARIVRERAKVVIVATDSTPSLAGKIEAVSEAYRTQFHQQSVGVISETACAAF